ncbi:MAG TPA: hypothetical protein VI007_10955 [bacterium]
MVASIAAVTAAATAAAADVDVPVTYLASVPRIEIIGHERDDLPPVLCRQPSTLWNLHQDLTPAILSCGAGSG